VETGLKGSHHPFPEEMKKKCSKKERLFNVGNQKILELTDFKHMVKKNCDQFL